MATKTKANAIDKLAAVVEVDGYEPVSTEVAIELMSLLKLARNKVCPRVAADVPLTEQPLDQQALVWQEMLCQAQGKKEVLKASQAFIVAYLSRTGVWQMHPDGYSELREFLRAAGVNESDIRVLGVLGDRIVPYCDARQIEVDHLLSPDNWPKLRDGVWVARRAVAENDAEGLQELFRDVEKATDRDVIRDKYQLHRQRIGQGTRIVKDGKIIFLIVVGNDEVTGDDAADALVRRLAGLIEWGMMTTEYLDGKVRIIW